MKLSGAAALFTFAALSGAAIVEGAHLKGKDVYKSRAAELRAMIESTFVEIEEDSKALPNAVASATGTVQGGTGATGAAAEAIVTLAEKKVKGLSREALAKVENATQNAMEKIANKMSGDKAGFGNFQGDADSLFDHDKELALNSESRNPLVVGDETEMRDRATGGAGSTGSGSTGVGGVGSIGKTGATGNANF